MNETSTGPDVPACVSVVDIDMPFASMVVFMIKWAFAAIQAAIVLGFVGVLIATVFGSLMGTLKERRSIGVCLV